MKRPVVKIVPTLGEKVIEVIGIIITVCMIIFPYVNYERLIFAYYTYHFASVALGITITLVPVIFLFIALLFGMIYYIVKMSRCL